MTLEVVKAKACLVGESGVGKTSLARRFVYDEFSDRYLATIGAKVSKKEIVVRVPDAVRVVLTVWDVMGVPSFRDLLGDGFFRGCQGVLAVGDVTRTDSIRALPDWVRAVRRVAGLAPTVIIGTKADLRAEPDAEDVIAEVVGALGAPHLRASAKTGMNVEAAFIELATAIASNATGPRPGPAADAPPGETPPHAGYGP